MKMSSPGNSNNMISQINSVVFNFIANFHNSHLKIYIMMFMIFYPGYHLRDSLA